MVDFLSLLRSSLLENTLAGIMCNSASLMDQWIQMNLQLRTNRDIKFTPSVLITATLIKEARKPLKYEDWT